MFRVRFVFQYQNFRSVRFGVEVVQIDFGANALPTFFFRDRFVANIKQIHNLVRLEMQRKVCMHPCKIVNELPVSVGSNY